MQQKPIDVARTLMRTEDGRIYIRVKNTVDCCDCVTVDTSLFYVTYRLVVGITFHSTHV